MSRMRSGYVTGLYFIRTERLWRGCVAGIYRVYMLLERSEYVADVQRVRYGFELYLNKARMSRMRSGYVKTALVCRGCVAGL